MPLLSGTKLGPYEILSALGAGGMGEVYRAHDTRLDRDVAIKVLPEYLTSDPERLRRFEQEARATAALSHPNILAIFEMDTHDGVSYLVEELLEGETLRERLGRGPVPLRKAIDYGVQIAHGLAAAHDKGIVHRDMKPENLFITKDGRVKILDFGLARLNPTKDASGFEATQALGTEPGMVMGTVGYMAPEQVRGKTADHRADIFAFGTILYEMVTGKPGFRKPTSAETMTAILNEEPPAISQITPTAPPGMQRVVHRCLEKNPEQRFQSASDLAFALEALSDSGIMGSSAAHPAQDSTSNRSRMMLAAVAALVAVLASIAVVYFFMQPSATPKASNFVQLTHDGQPKYLIGIEGSRLYLALPGAETSMAEMPTSGGDPKKLPILPSANMSPLALSPDGSEVLVLDGHGTPPSGPLWSVPVLSGSPRKLGDIEANDGAWSPDGKQIAYVFAGSLFIANADGSGSRKVVSMKASDILYSPVWSRDGRQLRFSLRGVIDRPARYWEVSLDGSNLHLLHPELPGFFGQCCGHWTSDGKYFVFWGSNQVWALPRNSGLFHRDAKPIQLTSSPIPLEGPIPSADGKKIFVTGRNVRGEIMQFDVRSGRREPFFGGISAEFLDFSKDGQWVAYVTYPEGNLWRSKLDGSERLQLTYPPAYVFNPCWSPDGKTILFYQQSPRGGESKAYAVSSEGGTPRPLLPEDALPQVDPNWSPDGSKVVLGPSPGRPEATIRILDMTTHQTSDVPGSKGLFSARFSPDGRYLAGLNSGMTGLFLFDFQTQKWTELAKGSPTWPKFSPDGQYLYVLDAAGNGAIIRVRLSDHAIEKVADLKNFIMSGTYSSWLSVAPDGSPLLLRDAGTTDVYSLDWEEP